MPATACAGEDRSCLERRVPLERVGDRLVDGGGIREVDSGESCGELLRVQERGGLRSELAGAEDDRVLAAELIALSGERGVLLCALGGEGLSRFLRLAVRACLASQLAHVLVGIPAVLDRGHGRGSGRR
ncbi:Uncharacterised protein [Streptococcus pyogenes]|nr:Uncharacterised protein [Streptococcus pyogenes]